MKAKWPTEDQWLEIAEAFDTPYEKRNEEQLQITYCRDAEEGQGICYALLVLGYRRQILIPFHDKGPSVYWWPTMDVGDRGRAFFCMFMAALSKRDVRGMEVKP